MVGENEEKMFPHGFCCDCPMLSHDQFVRVIKKWLIRTTL